MSLVSSLCCLCYASYSLRKKKNAKCRCIVINSSEHMEGRYPGGLTWFPHLFVSGCIQRERLICTFTHLYIYTFAQRMHTNLFVGRSPTATRRGAGAGELAAFSLPPVLSLDPRFPSCPPPVPSRPAAPPVRQLCRWLSGSAAS